MIEVIRRVHKKTRDWLTIDFLAYAAFLLIAFGVFCYWLAFKCQYDSQCMDVLAKVLFP